VAARGPDVERPPARREDRVAPGLSVVLPACGTGGVELLRFAVAAWRRQRPEPQVVISEQAVPGQEACRELAAELGADYICSYPERGPHGEVYFSRGRACNAGFLLCGKRYVCFADVDVTFPSPLFVSRALALLHTDASLCLVESNLPRLSEDGQGEFRDDLLAGRLAPDLVEETSPAGSYRYRNGRLEPAAEAAGAGERAREPARMAAVICPGAAFSAAEGFCEQYLILGYEDQDLTWKLASVARLGSTGQTALRLEQPQEPVERHALERNELLLECRKLRGVRRAIQHDRTDHHSLWGALRRRDAGQARRLIVRPEDSR